MNWPALALRWRLTVWYVCLLAVTLIFFSAAVYIALDRQLVEAEDDALRNLGLLLDGTISSDSGSLKFKDTRQTSQHGDRFVRLYDLNGTSLYDNSAEAGSVPLLSEGLAVAGAGRSRYSTMMVGHVRFRVLSLPIRREGQIVGVLQVGQELEDAARTIHRLLLILLAAVPLTLLVASGGGVFLASRILAPIDQLTRTAQQITAQDLSRRLGLAPRRDELGRLAGVFDDMIGRLDDAFRRQRQFTADASHELRTPLTAVRGQIEVALREQRTPAEYRMILSQALEQIERMSRMLASMLTLARADSAALPLDCEPLDLSDLVLSVAEQLQPLAEERGIRLEIDAPNHVAILGDQDRLLQVLFNLVENALIHTPRQGTVALTCGCDGGSAIVTVRDTGAGIPPEHLPHIFDRFYRADHSRRRTSGGAGLGLSIARTLVEAHDGCIAAESAVGRGTIFTIHLPLNNG